MAKLTRENIQKSAYNWLGTPFLANANVFQSGCDCAGLIVGIYGEFIDFHIERKGKTIFSALSSIARQIEIEVANIGDVLVFKNRASDSDQHCAILADNSRIIHSHWSRGVVENSYGQWFRARTIAAFSFFEV